MVLAAHIVAVVAFLGLTVACLAQRRAMQRRLLADDVPGARERRLLLHDYGLVTGWLLLGIGLLMAAFGAQVAVVVGPVGLGALFVLGAAVARLLGRPPWWSLPHD